MTDNISGYLTRLLGPQQVFQDVLDIPLGVNFKDYLKTNLASANVLLVIIGQRWLSITGEDGLRRLDNADDPVRMEVATALQNPTLLVIPILVDEALMPNAADLPEDLRELHYRNAARVRYNPDFEHDMQSLIGQIQQHVKIQSTTKTVSRVPRSWVWGGFTLLMLLAIVIFGLVSAGSRSTPPVVEPVESGQYMVLVTEIMPVDTTSRPVSQTLTENLQQQLEQDIPFSSLRVRRYTAAVSSDEEAQAVAQNVGASVIIWGDYTSSAVDLRVQIGSTDAFPTIGSLPSAMLTRAANIRLRLTNEREQSIASHIMAIMTLLHTADSDGYNLISALGALDMMPASTAEVTSVSIAARTHNALFAYVSETQTALDEFNAALEIDTNALLYMLRGYTLQRLGENQAALEDARTARSLAPDWLAPLYILGNDGWMFSDDLNTSRGYYDQLVTARPDDWFPLLNRGLTYYLAGDYAAGSADVDRIITVFKPRSNLAYASAISLALRAGDVNQISELKKTIVQEFPNPTEFNRFLKALYGQGDVVDKYGQGVNAVMYMALGQFSNALTASDTVLRVDESWADMHLLQGIAYCNLDQLEEAETAYTRAIELDPNFGIAYMMRAQIRVVRGNLIGSAADISTVQATAWGQQPAIQSLIEAGLRFDITCKTFFS